MTALQENISQSYRQEDIQQILQLAIAKQDRQGEFSRQQLLEIAAELEISPDCVEQAEQQWCQRQLENQRRQAFNRYRWGKLKRRIGNYLIVNIFLVTLNLLLSGTLGWSLYVLLFWGLAIALNAWQTAQTEGEEYEKAFQRWERQHQLRRSLEYLWQKFQQVLQV